MTPTEGPSPTGSDAGPAPQPGTGAEPVARGRTADEEARAAGGAVEDASGEDVPDGGRRGDTVAAVVRQWQAVHPGLDTGPMEIIGRINRCAALLQQAEDAPLRRAGLSRPEFDLLGALRRTGHELTPGDLARETFSSGAAVTKRLKQLTERGLVERRGDTRDRRVVHLRLTDAGRDLVDAILPVQLAYETAVLSGVDGPEQGELAALLGELLSQLEGRLGVLRA
ncbi:MarR family winged helix-turn-helix transcriptional regulator [Streptomyces iakyrus]|uniref:MarR family winged helix-turn-helix transcriptional regulator n=1 Tax=Streptomyces iakyrus TaxID=68219 RepID=UPI0036791437